MRNPCKRVLMNPLKSNHSLKMRVWRRSVSVFILGFALRYIYTSNMYILYIDIGRCGMMAMRLTLHPSNNL